MGLFGKSKDEKEREDQKKYEEAQRRMQEALRRREQEQQQTAPPAPATPAAPAAPAAPPATYTVQSGDSLSKIAKHTLGDANRWREIYEANREVIGDNPDLIKPGQQLRLPA